MQEESSSLPVASELQPSKMLLISRTAHTLAVLGTFLLLLKSGVSQSDSVFQSPNRMETQEGRTAFLHCNFSTSDSAPYLFWYRQYAGRGPQHILTAFKTRGQNTFALGKISTTLFMENKTVPLKIEGVSLQDGAVYYCALRDTGSYKQIFGGGTRLVVQPNIEDSEPSVYKLKPRKGDNENLSACLITDYSPGNILAGLNGSLESTSSSFVITSYGASYGTVVWDDKAGNFSCSASHKGKTYSDLTEDADGPPVEEFETDERLNFISITVLGLRVIFLKSVAINLLLTFRLWSC